jgi:hypothetical protein
VNARRALTLSAVAILWLDAFLLGYAGVVGGRVSLLVGAVACAIASVVVLAVWRRYRRTVAELAAARRDLAREVEAIQALLRARSSP